MEKTRVLTRTVRGFAKLRYVLRVVFRHGGSETLSFLLGFIFYFGKITLEAVQRSDLNRAQEWKAGLRKEV